MNSVLETLKSINNKIIVTCSSKIIFLPNLRLIYYNIHSKLFKKITRLITLILMFAQVLSNGVSTSQARILTILCSFSIRP